MHRDERGYPIENDGAPRLRTRKNSVKSVEVARRMEPLDEAAAKVVSWLSRAMREPDSTTTNVMAWRRLLYASDLDDSSVVHSLRRSDECNQVMDISARDAAAELGSGKVVALLAFWLFHGRFQDPVIGGSTWISIRSVDISGCNLRCDLCSLLFKSMIDTTPNLTSLNASANQIGGYADEDDFFIPVLDAGKELGNLIMGSKSLVSLSARYCNMGMHSTVAIANALSVNKHLTKLDVSNNSIWWDEKTVDELDSDRSFSRGALDAIVSACWNNHVLNEIIVSVAQLQPNRLCGRSLFGRVSAGHQHESQEKGISLKHLQNAVNAEKFQGDDPDNLRRISIGRSGNMGNRASRSDIVVITNLLIRNPVVVTFTLSGIHVNHEAAEGIVQLIKKRPLQLRDINLIKVQTPLKTAEVIAQAVIEPLEEQWKAFDAMREKRRKKMQRSTGFARTSSRVYYPVPGEGFTLQDCVSAESSDTKDGFLSGPLRTFSDVPIFRILDTGTNALTRLMLKGAGIGYHGALVLAALLRRSNSLSHLYLSNNGIGTRGAIALADSICSVNRSVKFIDMRGNGIECKALSFAAEALKIRLDKSYYEGEDRDDPRRQSETRPPVGDGWCPPPVIHTWDWQNNIIGGFGVSAELPGISAYLEAFRQVTERRAEIYLDSPASASVYLGGNQIRARIARQLVAQVQGTRLDLFVDVRQ